MGVDGKGIGGPVRLGNMAASRTGAGVDEGCMALDGASMAVVAGGVVACKGGMAVGQGSVATDPTELF